MKIIASAGHSKWLAEVDSYELRELNSDVSVDIGAEYEIKKAAETLVALRGLSHHKLGYLERQIKELQKSYSKIVDSYEEVMLLDTIRNSEDQ